MKKDKYIPMFGDPVTKWVRWFAWRPIVTEDRGVVWLGFVYKRRIQLKSHLNSPLDRWWQYVKEAE